MECICIYMALLHGILTQGPQWMENQFYDPHMLTWGRKCGRLPTHS